MAYRKYKNSISPVASSSEKSPRRSCSYPCLPHNQGTDSNHRFLYSISGEKAVHELVLATMLQRNFLSDDGDPAPRAAG